MEMCSLEPLHGAGRICPGVPSPSLPRAGGSLAPVLEHLPPHPTPVFSCRTFQSNNRHSSNGPALGARHGLHPGAQPGGLPGLVLRPRGEAPLVRQLAEAHVAPAPLDAGPHLGHPLLSHGVGGLGHPLPLEARGQSFSSMCSWGSRHFPGPELSPPGRPGRGGPDGWHPGCFRNSRGRRAQCVKFRPGQLPRPIVAATVTILLATAVEFSARVWVNFQDHPLDKGPPAGNPVTTPLERKSRMGRAPPGGSSGNCTQPVRPAPCPPSGMFPASWV